MLLDIHRLFNTVAQLSSRSLSDAIAEGKSPTTNAQDYARVLADVTEAMEEEKPSVRPDEDLVAIKSHPKKYLNNVFIHMNK